MSYFDPYILAKIRKMSYFDPYFSSKLGKMYSFDPPFWPFWRFESTGGEEHPYLKPDRVPPPGILSEIALDWMSISQRQDWFRLWLGVGQVWLPQDNATFSRSLSNKFTASPYVCFNGFRRLLMTGIRENVELKPRSLNMYGDQFCQHKPRSTQWDWMGQSRDWGMQSHGAITCDYLTHAQISTAAMMCLFWWE